MALDVGELPEESVPFTCGTALAGTSNWHCHQKKWSRSLPSRLLASARRCPPCRAGAAAGANAAAPTATAQLNVPQCPHLAALGVLLGQKGAGRGGWQGRDLGSGTGLQLLQETLMLHPHRSHCHPSPSCRRARRQGGRDTWADRASEGHGAALEMGLISYQGPRSLRAGLHLLRSGMATLPPPPVMVTWGNLCTGLLLFTAEGCPYGSVVLQKHLTTSMIFPLSLLSGLAFNWYKTCSVCVCIYVCARRIQNGGLY